MQAGHEFPTWMFIFDHESEEHIDTGNLDPCHGSDDCRR